MSRAAKSTTSRNAPAFAGGADVQATMSRDRRRWRVVKRELQPTADTLLRPAHGTILVVTSGIFAGLLTVLLARELSPAMAPMAMLVVLTSALVVGRLAATGPALAHGGCAWLAIMLTSTLNHASTPSWHGHWTSWMSLLLIEDMVMIGRIGYVRRRVNRTPL